MSSISRNCSGRGGSSIGWVVSQKCSAKYSDGCRLRCGTSRFSFFQAESSRHASGGSQANPPSISTIFRFGNRSKTPSVDEADDLRLERRGHPGVVLEVV